MRFQDLVELYTRAVGEGGAAGGGGSKGGAPGSGKLSNLKGGSSSDGTSKMTPAEKKQEMAKRRAQANKEKVIILAHGDAVPYSVG